MQAALPDKRQVGRQFSRSAARYGEYDQVQRLMNQALVRWLPDYRRLLELGCADGRTLRELADRFPQRTHLALDLAAGMLAELQRQAPQLPAIQADMEQLPLTDQSCDLIYCCAALQWTHTARALQEISRVLAPGGTLLLGTLVAGSLREWQQAWERADGKPRVHQLPAAADILAQIQQAELQIDAEQHLEYCCEFSSPEALLRDIKGLGGTHAAAGRPRGLLGKHTYQRFRSALLEIGCLARYQIVLLRAHKA